MRLPFAIGAVVDGLPSTFQTPLSGQMLPVDTRVPMGLFVAVAISLTPAAGFAILQIGSKCLAVRAEDKLLYPTGRCRLPSAIFRSGGGAVCAAPPFAFAVLPRLRDRRKRKALLLGIFDLHAEVQCFALE